MNRPIVWQARFGMRRHFKPEFDEISKKMYMKCTVRSPCSLKKVMLLNVVTSFEGAFPDDEIDANIIFTKCQIFKN